MPEKEHSFYIGLAERKDAAMNVDRLEEMEEEMSSLRVQVARLSEGLADRRARVLHLEALVARLREELRQARTSP